MISSSRNTAVLSDLRTYPNDWCCLANVSKSDSMRVFKYSFHSHDASCCGNSAGGALARYVADVHAPGPGEKCQDHEEGGTGPTVEFCQVQGEEKRSAVVVQLQNLRISELFSKPLAISALVLYFQEHFNRICVVLQF